MKTFLALIEGSGADAAILEAAHTLAKAMNGHIDVLHVDLTALERREYAPQADFARGRGAARTPPVIGCARQGGRRGTAGLRGDLRAPWRRRNERTFAFRTCHRALASRRLRRARPVDPERAPSRSHHLPAIPLPVMPGPGDLIERLLTETGRPLLLLPQGRRDCATSPT